MSMTAYNFSLFAHVLVVVYLLGADLGRAYLARLGAAAGATEESQRLAARGVLWLGSATNLGLVLILPVGVSLGAALGVYRIAHPAWLIGTWVVAGLWILLSVWADRSAGSSQRRIGIADVAFRLMLAPGFIYDGAIVFAGTSQTVDAKWLAFKLILFGLLILISIPSRWIGFGLRRALASEDSVGIQTALSHMRLPMVLGWAAILLAGWFGVAKPL